MVRNKIYKIILLAAVFFHLTLVALNAFHRELAVWIPMRSMLEFYQKASGANGSYGFFAPSVGVKTRALFDIVSSNGERIFDIPLVAELPREVELRLGGISDEFLCEVVGHKKLRTQLATSLAASIFSQYVNATEATLRVEKFHSVTMDEYRQGRRGAWSEYYAARFVKSSELTK